MRRLQTSLFTLFFAIGASVASADPADPYSRDSDENPTPQKEARGWERRPTNPGVPVLSPVASALKTSARFAINVIVAPLRGLILLEDRHQVYSKVQEVFYNEDLTGGVLPTASFVSGIGFSYGASIFYKDLWGNDELVRLKGLYGGSDFYSADLKIELPELLDNRVYVRSRGRIESNSKRDFTGIGNSGSGLLEPNGRSRFKEERFLFLGQAGLQFGSKQQLRTGVSLIYNHREFSEDISKGPPAIGTRYDTTQLSGFQSGVEVFEATADVSLDLRDFGENSSSGAMLSAFGGGAATGDWDYMHYGSEATLYWTPWRKGRVFIFRTAHEGIHGDNVPFTELPRLGGAEKLRGYRSDRYRDELSVLGTVEYRYPIHHFVSGALFVETGKVASDYNDLLGEGLGDDWHTGVGGGLTVHTGENLVVNLHLAVGDGVQFYMAADVLHAFRGRGREL